MSLLRNRKSQTGLCRKSSIKEITIHLKHLTIDDGKFTSEETCSHIALKLNSFWRNNIKKREKLLNEEQHILWGRATAALEELISVENVEQGDEDKFFSKMVALCILMSGLGSPTSETVIKETYPALHSVIKVADLSRITDFSRPEKEQHLLEVVQIVMGIRLFNKDCRKGGEGIDDLPDLLSRAVQATKSHVISALESVRERCEGVTSALSCVYRLHSDGDNNNQLTLPEHKLQQLKTTLCLVWIQILCLLDIRCEVTSSETHVKACVDQLRETLVQLHETVRYRSAIPTVQVYPLFVQLSLVWRELQYEAAVLSQFSQWLQTISATIKKLDDLQTGQYISSSTNVCKLSLSSIKNAQTANVELRGFCPWTLMQTKGVLIMGSHIDGKFAFRSQEAAIAWYTDPDRNYQIMHQHISANAELTDFLQIPPKPQSEFENKKKKLIETADIEIQTDIHPVESYIDSNYVWSEWQLKSRALQLAKITRCQTKSQQTAETSFRISKSIQCSIYYNN